MDAPTDPPARSDVDLLLDLLDLIPYPDIDDHGEFWENVSAALGGRLEPDYMVGKLAPHIEALTNGTATVFQLLQLTSYCLMFFDGDRPELWAVLDTVGTRPGLTGAAGRRWAQSVSDVAWRLYVPLRAAERRQEQPHRRHAQTLWQLRQL